MSNKFKQTLDKNLPSDYTEYLENFKITNEHLVALGKHPRSLFSFFDEQKLYISSLVTKDVKFSYNIHNLYDTDDDAWDTRDEADEQAVLKCASILEEKL
jgi:hypothetical protein